MRAKICLMLMIALLAPWQEASAVIPQEIVYDPFSDADIVKTFAYFETEITDLEKQLTTLNNQLNDLDKQLDALKKLDPNNYNWSNTTELMNQLADTLSQANALSYTAQNESEQFQKLFPGYTPANNYSDQLQQMTHSSLDTINNVLQNMGISADDFAKENSRLQFLQSKAQDVVGQTQAIQMAAQLASEQISQLQLLRQVAMAAANSQAMYYAQQIQKEASAHAELNTILGNGTVDTTGKLDEHPLAKPNYQ